KAGFANQKKATSAGDGLQLVNCAITNACHCAPPGNKPTVEELVNCAAWFEAALAQLPVRVLLALGGIAWSTVWNHFRSNSPEDLLPDRKPKFGHGAFVQLTEEITLVGSYHPSQQNTFTGRLTEPMLNAVFRKARKLIDSDRP
ncbi:MAG TPA: uracil-DNA glycosylase, partial [Planctomycetes bacterium]|nr:uracil-DNA glycosylase [Planctomycetota bacterium]